MHSWNRLDGSGTHQNNNITNQNKQYNDIFVGQRLCKNMVLRRHVCIVFLPNPPIAILKLPNCSNHG